MESISINLCRSSYTYNHMYIFILIYMDYIQIKNTYLDLINIIHLIKLYKILSIKK